MVVQLLLNGPQESLHGGYKIAFNGCHIFLGVYKTVLSKYCILFIVDFGDC